MRDCDDFGEILEEAKISNKLDLSDLQLSKKEMVSLCNFIKTNDNIKKLDMSHTYLGSEESDNEKEFCLLFTTLAQAKHIETLVLSNDYWGDSRFEGLCSLIEMSSTIKKIDLSNVNITGCVFSPNRLKRFCDSLSKNESLRKVNIEKCLLHPEDVPFIIEMLFSNRSLTRLCIDKGNWLSDYEDLSRIYFLVRCNEVWCPEIHRFQYAPFKLGILAFCLSLKKFQQKTGIKIPKFVLFEIIKMVDRKSYYSITFDSGNIPFELGSYKIKRRKKRISTNKKQLGDQSKRVKLQKFRTLN